MTTSRARLMQWAAEREPRAESKIHRALSIAEQAHRGQVRRSGDPYITHPIAVANILAEHGADIETVIVALLHDLPDTTAVLPSQLRDEFGDKAVTMLEEFTSLDRAGQFDERTNDIRALHIKIVDRLHNMRTIKFLDRSVQERKADQTLRIVAPLARSIGLSEFGDELESLATSTLRSFRVIIRTNSPTASTEQGGLTTGSGLLRAGVHILPKQCQDRWLKEWEAELCALSDGRARLTFAFDVLLGLPYMAILTRRTERS